MGLEFQSPYILVAQQSILISTSSLPTFPFAHAQCLQHIGKSTGNLWVSRAIPVPNLPKNLYLHGGYRFSNGYATGDLYLYPHRFTHGYEQMGSTCQRVCIVSTLHCSTSSLIHIRYNKLHKHGWIRLLVIGSLSFPQRSLTLCDNHWGMFYSFIVTLLLKSCSPRHSHTR